MSKKCQECQHCQQVPISAVCVELESDNYSNIKEFAEDIEERVEKIETPHTIDAKTLSSDPNISKDDIIQLLIDAVLKLQKNSTTSNLSGNSCFGSVDFSSVINCTGLNESQKLQELINTVAILKQQVNELL